MKNSLRASSFLAGLTSVTLATACSGLTSNQAIRAANAQRSADGKAVGVALKITDFPKALEESGCSAQAEVHATLLEPDREPVTVKSQLKRGGSLQIARVPAKASRLRLEIRLAQENRTIFQAEGPLSAASAGTLNVSLAQDGAGSDSFKIEASPKVAAADTALQIWQGQAPTAATLSSTVMLTYGAGRSLCSGALVCGPDGKFDPNKAWVLTAAHCMTPSFAAFGQEGYTSTRKCTATGPTAVHPGMKELQSARGPLIEHDIALVQFQCPASALAGVACAKLNTESLAAGETIIVAGYGKLSTALAPGKLMQTTSKVAAESARDGAKPQFGDILGGAAGGKIVAQTTGTGICAGDSGGPSYVIRNNVTYVTGVHSGGSCDMNPNYSVMIDIGVAAHMDWITQSMAGGAGGAGGVVAAPSAPSQDPMAVVGQPSESGQPGQPGQPPVESDGMSPVGAPGTSGPAPTQKAGASGKTVSTGGESTSPSSVSQTCSALTVSTKQGANDK